MPYDLGVIKRQRREPPVISTSTYGGNFVGFYSTGSNYYAVHVFTSSGQFTKPSYVTTTTAQVLVVAGGGGGGGPATVSGVGGGGGAGGVVNSSTYSLNSGTLIIQIGAGGTTNIIGNVSSVTNGISVLAASGGGNGAIAGATQASYQGKEGGSGGGGASTSTNSIGGTNTSTQGNIGGGSSQNNYAGGGGGASAVGGFANAGGPGQGGSGTITLITGSPIWVAGGGGGGANAVGYNNGSYGGGGAGGNTSAIAGFAGANYSGGGGGGGGGTAGVGGAGGGGIVIISYAIPANLYPSIQSDPYFSNNSLLLNGTTATSGGSAVITYGVFADQGPNGFSIINYGPTASTANPFDQSPYHSLYFNGNNYLTIGANTNYNFIHSTTAIITIEFWVYPTSLTSSPFIFSTNAGNVIYTGGGVQINSAGTISFTISNGSISYVVQATSSGTIPNNAWSHVAVTWDYVGNTGAFYINGKPSGTFVRGAGVGSAANSSLALIVGQSGSNSNFYNGYVSNLRLVNGTVVYSGSFELSKEPLSTVLNGPAINVATIISGTSALVGKFVTNSSLINDYGTNNFSVSNTTGVTPSTLNPFTPLVNESAYFSQGQYLTVPADAAWTFGTGDFTMECWVYWAGSMPTDLGQYAILSNMTQNNGTWELQYYNNAMRLAAYGSSGSFTPYYIPNWAINGNSTTGSGKLAGNTWYHIAATRLNGTGKIWVNGGDVTASTTVPIGYNNLYVNRPLYIGQSALGSQYYWQGYISNVRIVKGLAVYTGNFPLPTGPLQVTQLANPYGGINTQAISTASYTSLLTLKYGTYGVNPVGFIENGTNNLTVVPTGNPGQGTFSPFGNNWSTLFNGTTDYLSIPVIYSSSATLTSLNFGSNDWTVESWVYLTANTGTAYIAGQFNTSNFAPVGLYLIANKPTLGISNLTTQWNSITTATSALSTGTWNHIAAVRNSNRFSVYVNGIEQAYTLTSVTLFSTNTNMLIGRAGSAVTSMFPGYLSNLRIVNSTTVYTSAFTPPRAPLSIIPNTSLLIAASSYHVDKSVNNFIVTTGTVLSLPNITKFTPYKIPGEYNRSIVGASIYFNTTTAASQNLSLGTWATLALGSGNYTVECWVYPQSYNANTSSLIDWRTNAGTTAGVPVLYLLAAGNIQWQNTGGTGFLTSPAPLPLNTWNHIAMVRYNSTLYMYINGVEVASAADSTTLTIQTLFINSPVTASNQTLFGYISNVRILVGRAIYTPTISVPTTTLTTVTNTVLLALQNDAPGLKDNSINNFALTKPNTSTVFHQVLSPFGGSGSAYFNGVNNYLIITTGTNLAFNFDVNDFTLEAWVYPTARNGTYGSLIIGPVNYPTTIDWIWMINAAGYLYVQLGAATAGSGVIVSTSQVPLSQWSHVACVRLYGVMTLYINGQAVGTSITSLTNQYAAGSLSFNGSNQYLTAGVASNWTFLHDGTTDYTAECWFYTNSTGYQNLFDTATFTGDIGFEFSINYPGAGQITLVIYRGVGSTAAINIITVASLFTTGTWNHVAATFVSSTKTTNIFVNGASVSPNTGYTYVYTPGVSNTFSASAPLHQLYIGGQSYFNGYITNARITKSIVYTATFPPTVPLSNLANTSLLLLVGNDTNKIIDSSSSPFTLTNVNGSTYSSAVPSAVVTSLGSTVSTTYAAGSLYFAGGSNNQRLSLAASSAFDFSGGTYTIEFWMYSTATPSSGNDCRIFMFGVNQTTTGYNIGYNYLGQLYAVPPIAIPYVPTNPVYVATAAGTILLNTWYHVALVSNAGSASIYINGKLNAGPVAITLPTSSSPTLYIGYDTVGTVNFQYQGYLSNIRIINGTAYYNTSFTPTIPLTNVTNTKLLLLVNIGSALTDSSSSPLTVTNSASPVTYSTSIVPSVTITSGGIVTATNTINVGIGAAINGNAATTFNGYITNLHVINGVGKYTGSFTPSTSDLNTVTNTALLTLLSTDTTFIDRSLNSFAITNSTTATTLQGFSPYNTSSWGTYFDGNTYMYVRDAQPLVLSTSTNWTIETWVNPTGNYGGGDNILFAKRSAGLTFKSMSFNGTTQYLSISTGTNAFAFAGNDFTIECWFYGSGALVGRGPNDNDDELLILANSSGQYYVDWGTATEYFQTNTGLFATTQWTHMALVRYGSLFYLYQNGTLVSNTLAAGSTTITRALTNNYAFRIGQYRSSAQVSYFSGYISSFRVVNGLAVYTGNFNPPDGLLSTSQIANPFGGINTQVVSTSNTTLLIGQFNNLNNIADLSVNNSAVTNNNTVVPALTGPTFYNSIQFNGTNQYLTAPVGASTFGTGDFTVECWFYKTAATTCGILDNATGNADNNYWSLATYADGHCQFQIRDSSGQAFVIGSIIPAINTWVYVAVTRQSGLVKLFVNGVLDNSATITKAITARITNIGSFQYAGFVDYFTGYISNVKLLTGLSIYNTTTSFAAPTAPLSKYISVLATSAAGSYSLSLGTSSVVDFTNSSFATGTGDFTAECWVWMDASSNGNAGFMTSVSTTVPGFMIARDIVGLVPANGSGNNDWVSWTVPHSSWNHVALTLRSGQVQAWLNGELKAYVTRTYISTAGTSIRLGGRYSDTLSFPFVGYISNARFVVGVGVYTGNFTVPTTQLQTTQPSGANIQAISNARSVQLLTAQTNSITDFSTTATSVAVTGSVVTTNNSTYIPTLSAPAYSLLINSSYLSTPVDAAFQFGTGDFTIECWFYWNGTAPLFSNTSQYPIISNLPDWELQYYNGNWRFAPSTGGNLLSGSGSTLTGNTWYHIAVTRASGVGQMWLNGSSITNAVSFTTNLSSTAQVSIGGSSLSWPGYISNVRVVKGFAVYTGSFTPPTSMLRSTQVGSGNIQSISTASLVSLLVGQSNIATIDNSKNNFSITNTGAGVGVINGTSPFATAAAYDASYTSLLTANFIGTATSITDNSSNLYTITQINAPTISVLSPFGVVYATTSTSYQGYLSSSTGYLGFYNGTTYSTSTTALTTGTWNHVAYTYDSSALQSTVNIYVNGFRALQTTATIFADASENLHIGGLAGASQYFYGYMSNFRIVKGSSLYLGSYFGVPNSKLNITTNTIPYPLTSTISTSLLTLQDNRIVDNSTNAYSLTVSGTPKTITFSPFFTNTNISAYFNGTSDFINVSAQAALSLGIGDFTIDVWVYPTAVPTSYAPVIEARAGQLATPWIAGMITSGGVLKSVLYDGSALTAATTIQLNVWTHLAWSRTNSILRMFVNGQIDYTSANHIINLAAQTTNQFIGKTWNGYYFQGFMSNLRVVNGRSLYTGNFNPSQIPLTQVSGGTTNLLTTFVDGRGIDYTGNTVVKANTSTLTLISSVTKYNLYSMNFNGTSDVLTVSSSTGFIYNYNDFTWEMWVYPTSPRWATTSTYFIEHGLYGGSLRYANNKVFYSNITTATSTASFILSINSSTWTHLAVVRANTVTSVFVNGSFAVSTPDSYNYSVQPIITIGNTSSSTYVNNYFQGYIEDLRITKGLARYLTTFVPPTKLSNR